MVCPQCKTELSPDGELDNDGHRLLVYQCDSCTRPWEFDGETFDTALTFAVDGAGNFYDPETLAPLNLN